MTTGPRAPRGLRRIGDQFFLDGTALRPGDRFEVWDEPSQRWERVQFVVTHGQPRLISHDAWMAYFLVSGLRARWPGRGES
jgi:hypothetical protein